MPVKLTKIDIGGFRGVKERLEIPLASARSLLLYGENGGGKSSITDGVEWFYHDRVEHLASDEIGRNGIPALRNTSLRTDQDAFVALGMNEPSLSASKTLSMKKERLVSTCSNTAVEYEAYLASSTSENIILRYRDLLQFILYTKAQKLEEISQIIGFGEVTKVKATLKKAANDLRRFQKARDYEGQINRQQREIIDHLGQNVATEDQFVRAAKILFAPLSLAVEVTDLSSLEKAIALAKTPADEETIRLEMSYGNLLLALQAVRDGLSRCKIAYQEYHKRYEDLRKEAAKLAYLSLEKLLAEGAALLEGSWSGDDCPLCLQKKSREDLIKELRVRRAKLVVLRKEREALDEAKNSVIAELREISAKADAAAHERCLDAKGSIGLKNGLESMSSSLAEALNIVSGSMVLERATILSPEEFLKLDQANLKLLTSSTEEQKEATGKQRRGVQRFDVIEKISLAKKAYSEVCVMRAEREAVYHQVESMDRICREYVKREREALTNFLTGLSADIEDMYLFMNPDERIEGIKLVPVGEEDEFVGITLEMMFHGKAVSPPGKYLSESHVNCLGICLFLASVKAFNKINRFFILDDVISSFDANHRAKFGQLLQERFKEYQIMLFTHERNWYEYMVNIVKGAGWVIQRVAWDEQSGVVLRPAPMEPKEAILNKIARSDIDGAGNAMRIYLESLLKRISLSCEVRLSFQLNEKNEDRMPGEMLSGLRSTLGRHKCDLKDNPVLERLSASTFLAHKSSHDTKLTIALGDLKSLWIDIEAFEKLFVCNECSKLVDTENVNNAGRTISCACGTLKHSWQP